MDANLQMLGEETTVFPAAQFWPVLLLLAAEELGEGKGVANV